MFFQLDTKNSYRIQLLKISNKKFWQRKFIICRYSRNKVKQGLMLGAVEHLSIFMFCCFEVKKDKGYKTLLEERLNGVMTFTV